MDACADESGQSSAPPIQQSIYFMTTVNPSPGKFSAQFSAFYSRSSRASKSIMPSNAAVYQSKNLGRGHQSNEGLIFQGWAKYGGNYGENFGEIGSISGAVRAEKRREFTWGRQWRD